MPPHNKSSIGNHQTVIIEKICLNIIHILNLEFFFLLAVGHQLSDRPDLSMKFLNLILLVLRDMIGKILR